MLDLTAGPLPVRGPRRSTRCSRRTSSSTSKSRTTSSARSAASPRTAPSIEFWTPYAFTNEAFLYGHLHFLTEETWMHFCVLAPRRVPRHARRPLAAQPDRVRDPARGRRRDRGGRVLARLRGAVPEGRRASSSASRSSSARTRTSPVVDPGAGLRDDPLRRAAPLVRAREPLGANGGIRRRDIRSRAPPKVAPHATNPVRPHRRGSGRPACPRSPPAPGPRLPRPRCRRPPVDVAHAGRRVRRARRSPTTRTSSACSGPATPTAKFRVEARSRDGKWKPAGHGDRARRRRRPRQRRGPQRGQQRIGARVLERAACGSDDPAQVRVARHAGQRAATSASSRSARRRDSRTRLRARARSTSTRSPPAAWRSPRPARSRPGDRAARSLLLVLIVGMVGVRRADRRAERQRGRTRRRPVPAEPRLREPRAVGRGREPARRPRAPKAPTTRRRSSSSCTTPRRRTRTRPRRPRRPSAASTSITSRAAATATTATTSSSTATGSSTRAGTAASTAASSAPTRRSFNTGTIGIAMIGDHSNVPPTAATFNALANLIAWKMSVHQINPFVPVAFRGAILNRDHRAPRRRADLRRRHRVSGQRGLTAIISAAHREP